MMGASFDSVKAQNKELSRSDSVSYAAGMNYTIGLLPYLSRQAGVDTTKMDDFIRFHSVRRTSSPYKACNVHIYGFEHVFGVFNGISLYAYSDRSCTVYEP